MKRGRVLLILMLLITLTTLYFYFYSIFTYDAVWNYGFAYNIYKGLIPYKDYNMIITPLFPYLLSLFILIFGNKLILYYLFIAILIVSISYLCYKKVGYKALFIYLLLLSIHELGYNVLALFFFMLLLYFLDKRNINDIVIAVIISLMILTKQTLGILIIPSIIYSRNKKKTILIYIVTFLLLLIYLLINNNIFEFIDYCFMGMLDFTSGNGTKFNVILLGEIIVCLCLLVGLIRSNYKNRELLYILLFQIIVFPIVDGVHFIITFIPVLYYMLYKINYKYYNYIIYLTVISFTLVYNIYQLDYSLDTLYNNKNSFMYGKRVQGYLNEYFAYVNKNINKYNDYTIFYLDSRAYLIKLEMGIIINKYDLINNGNMGYSGDLKYIDEIDNYCKDNKCLFLINYQEYNNKEGQINKNILKYVIKNYNQVSATIFDNMYIN